MIFSSLKLLLISLLLLPEYIRERRQKWRRKDRRRRKKKLDKKMKINWNRLMMNTKIILNTSLNPKVMHGCGCDAMRIVESNIHKWKEVEHGNWFNQQHFKPTFWYRSFCLSLSLSQEASSKHKKENMERETHFILLEKRKL